MLSKNAVIEAANQYGFADVGFTGAEPFSSHREFLADHQDKYGWAEAAGLHLMDGTDPQAAMPGARSIVVLLSVYFHQAYPQWMEGYFGRCYLDDDRVTKDGLTRRVKAFRGFLKENGIESSVPGALPQRMAAARAGLGTLGKNCLLFSNRVARKSSWVLPVAVVVDAEFEPDPPTIKYDCPDWCRNVCIAACPTRALDGKGRLDPQRCVSFLTYFGPGLTPRELRQPMGVRVYGCDCCQDVCPRNSGWLAADLPPNERVVEKSEFFELPRLLHMDADYYTAHIWPHMFYMPAKEIWRWKMNVARAMGNTCDPRYIGHLVRAFEENGDSRVQSMAAWALGRIGGSKAAAALEKFKSRAAGSVIEEIEAAREVL